ncbi:MAG: GNAT family N-acetyltransferase [Pseudomonadota bacterium]
MAATDPGDILIRRGGLEEPAVQRLLAAHLAHSAASSPPESVHALASEALGASDIAFWSAWSGEGEIAGCGALRALDRGTGEVKSMHTASGFRRRGVARALLGAILAEARARRYDALFLETGSMEAFAAARALYAAHGFRPCGPFADYRPDPHSVFMRLALDGPV